MKSVKIYLFYCRVSILKLIEYRSSFFIGILGLIAVNGVSLLLIWTILTQFHRLGDWSFWEIVFNYSMFLACLGFHKIFFRNLSSLSNYIEDGTFDRYLIRPYSPCLQVIGEEFSFTDISDFIMGMVLLVLSFRNLNLSWGFTEYVTFILTFANGVYVFTIILLIINSLAFWLIKATPFLYGTAEIQETVQHYPVNIFGAYFKWFVTLILPYAMTNYYPSLLLLKKTDATGSIICIVVMIVVSLFLSIIARFLWVKGINHYQSTGS